MCCLILWVGGFLIHNGKNVCLLLNPSCSKSEKADDRENIWVLLSQTSVAMLKTVLVGVKKSKPLEVMPVIIETHQQ